uniref:Copper chaperone for superoxide dismutase n=1 Tax=Cacopsylla melanoneura TaxID=428564 RepID=A0A8D9DZY6_9HEMI
MKIEYAVQMSCDSCVQKVKQALSGLEGISKMDIDLASGTVMVDSELPQSIIKDKIETTGMRAVLKGYGQLGAAVAMLGGNTGFSAGNVKGVIRFVQEDANHCIIDGEIETPPNTSKIPLTINIYECGDISNNCSNVGDKLLSILNQNWTKETLLSKKKNESDLLATDTFQDNQSGGNPNGGPKISTNDTIDSSISKSSCCNSSISSDKTISDSILTHSMPLIQETPHGLIVKTKNKLDVSSIIGRSIVIEDGASNKLACAVIARSAGVSENKKSICACDGVTIWEERDRPLAGPGRRIE